MLRYKFLKNVWKFEDLHNEHAAPSHIHRLPKLDIKHINTVGDSLMITNSQDANVDVYGIDSDLILKTLNIQGREMNCSIVSEERVYIGTKDRRIFVYGNRNLNHLGTIECADGVHCFTLIDQMNKIAVGMQDGHVWILDAVD
jgi:hypothetical protein